MAIPTYEGVVTSASGGGGGGGTSVTPDISTIDGGSPPTVGDLIFVHLTLEDATDTVDNFVTPPTGYVHGGASHNLETDVIFWKIWASGDDTTPTFTWNGGTRDYIISVHCIRGVDQTRPIARQSINRYDDSNFVWLAETTPVADCLALAVSTVDDNRSGSTAPTGWTERVDTEVGVNLGQWAMTQGFASASTSTGTGFMDIGGIGVETIQSRMIVFQPPQDVVHKNKDIRTVTGSLTSPTSTGNQDITGLGFDCKALIIYGMRVNTDTVLTDAEYVHGIGADDGVTASAQRCAGVWKDSGVSAPAGWSRNGEIIALYFAGNATLASPDLLATYSRITDGFRLNWTAVNATGYVFNYIAFGGADLEAVCGAEQGSTSPVSGLPWRPDMVHICGQCLDSDADQLRNGVLLGNLTVGYLDPQAGVGWNAAFDLNTSGPMRDAAFASQVNNGALTYDLQFSQTTSDGWSWFGSNTDYFFFLAFNWDNATYYPAQIEVWRTDLSGVDDTNQTMSNFAVGQDFSFKQMMHTVASDFTTSVDPSNWTHGEGQVSFRNGVVDQDTFAFGFVDATNGAERNRKPDDALFLAASGDLNSPGKVGRWTDDQNINWSTNDSIGYLIGMFTLGRMDDGYPIFFASL